MSNEQNKHGFTPGPWVIDGNYTPEERPFKCYVRANHDPSTFLGMLICRPYEISDHMQPEVCANLHLIAAAPDLYEALDTIFLTAPYGLSVEKLLQDISDVLAKARGEK